jgi:nicotinate-nucleotide adenylyltransferase
MTRAAVAGEALFNVDDLELARTGPSYTFDTARQLFDRGEGPVDWLIGADMLMYLPNWHRAVELLSEVKFIIMARPGWSLDWKSLPPAFRQLESHVVQAPSVDIRATDIRLRVSQGKPIRFLTPDSVCKYICENSLYKNE